MFKKLFLLLFMILCLALAYILIPHFNYHERKLYKIDGNELNSKKLLYYFDNRPILLSELHDYFIIKNSQKIFPLIDSNEFKQLQQEYMNILLLSKKFDDDKLAKLKLYKKQKQLLLNNLKTEVYLAYLKENINNDKLDNLKTTISKEYKFINSFVLQILLVKNRSQAWTYYWKIANNPNIMSNLIKKHSFKLSKNKSNYAYSLNNKNRLVGDEKLLLIIALSLSKGKVMQPIKLSKGFAIIRMVKRSTELPLENKEINDYLSTYLFKVKLDKILKELESTYIQEFNHENLTDEKPTDESAIKTTKPLINTIKLKEFFLLSPNNKDNYSLDKKEDQSIDRLPNGRLPIDRLSNENHRPLFFLEQIDPQINNKNLKLGEPLGKSSDEPDEQDKPLGKSSDEPLDKNLIDKKENKHV